MTEAKLCTVEGCTKLGVKRGWCGTHYARWKRHGDPTTKLTTRGDFTICQVEGCDETPRTKGWCPKHYGRFIRHGDPTTLIRGTVQLTDYFDPTLGPDACWPWQGTISPFGYGIYNGQKKPGRAHRMVYEAFVGPIPKGLMLDHTCHDPTVCRGGSDCPHRRCVNPNHLLPVTHAQNVARGRMSTPALWCKCGCAHCC